MTKEQLKIVWEDEQVGFLLQQLAERYSVREATDNIVRHFAIPWRIGNVKPDDRAQVERLTAIRRWVYDRVRYIAYDRRAESYRVRIAVLRKEWEENYTEVLRLVPKANRIKEYERIYHAALAAGDFDAATRAMREVRIELEGASLRLEGSVTHHHVVHRESDDVRRIDELLTRAGCIGTEKAAYIRLLTSAAVPRPVAEADATDALATGTAGLD